MGTDIRELLSAVNHTLLAPTATPEDVSPFVQHSVSHVKVNAGSVRLRMRSTIFRSVRAASESRDCQIHKASGKGR